ncbi:RHS repeat-associated core domain-containing protein, partial [Dokdonella soli]
TLTFGNTRTLTKTYDQDYAISSIASSVSGGLTLGLGVDVMGDITRASASLNPATPDRRYAYDPLYRLTTAQTGATPPAPLESYSYDKTGDRLSASLNGGAAQAYAYTAGTHQLTSVAGVARTYDLNGNTTAQHTGQLPTLSYDDRNRLSYVHVASTPGSSVCDPITEICASYPGSDTTETYALNGRGERVGKSRTVVTGGGPTLTSSTWFVYGENGQMLGDYAKTGAVQNEYVYLDNVPVAVVASGTLYALETDHLGTPRLAFNPTTNATVWSWDPLASTFGTNAPTGSLTLNLRFPGQYYDSETGLHYNYFRDYEPGTGRYIESDPIGLWGGLNTYAYVNDNPLIASDPTGLKARICCRKISAIPALGHLVVHCFIDSDSGGQTGLHGDWDDPDAANGEAFIRNNNPFNDPNAEDTKCGPWTDNCDTDDCVKKAIAGYPNPSKYSAVWGPNSNTFASTVASACHLKKPNFGWARGWGHSPAPPYGGGK